MHTFPPLSVGAADVEVLRGLVGSGASAAGRRARIVLLSGEGLGPTAVATMLGCSKQTVITWRERYRAEGLPGLSDAPRSGRPVSVDPVAVIEKTLEDVPSWLRARRWSTRLVAAELGVSNVAVANVWRSWGVAPLADGHVRLAAEPPIDQAPTAIVGAHLGPGLRVVALSTADEEPVPLVPLCERPRLGRRLDDLDLGTRADPRAVTAFLDGLPAGAVRLLADVAPPAVQSWAGRFDVPVHVVPAELSWTRLLRVAGVLAGRTASGARGVAELRRAVLEHGAGYPLSWHNPFLVASSSR